MGSNSEAVKALKERLKKMNDVTNNHTDTAVDTEELDDVSVVTPDESVDPTNEVTDELSEDHETVVGNNDDSVAVEEEIVVDNNVPVANENDTFDEGNDDELIYYEDTDMGDGSTVKVHDELIELSDAILDEGAIGDYVYSDETDVVTHNHTVDTVVDDEAAHDETEDALYNHDGAEEDDDEHDEEYDEEDDEEDDEEYNEAYDEEDDEDHDEDHDEEDDEEDDEEYDEEDEEDSAPSASWLKAIIMGIILIIIFVVVGYVVLMQVYAVDMAPQDQLPNMGAIMSHIAYNIK